MSASRVGVARMSFVSFALVVAVSAFAAEPSKIPLYTEKEVLWPSAGSLSSSFSVMPLPAQGALSHAILVDGYDFASLTDSIPAIRDAYNAGQPIVVVAPTEETQAFLDDVTGGDVDLPEGAAQRPKAVGDPRLEALAFRRPASSTTPDVSEFWAEFDSDTGPAAEEKASHAKLVASIGEWVSGADAAPAAKAPATGGRTLRARAAAEPKGRPSLDELTSAVVRKVSLSFDKGSMATVVRSWAAYSPQQDEDWYIFELNTTSQPLNFATWSFTGMFSDWAENDEGCKALAKTGCMRKRYATKTEVKLAPKTPGLELLYYGPDSDRAQDEYTYSSKFSLGGKITGGFDEKGAKGGVELSGGTEFSRSTKVTIKDATLIGISNTSTDIAGWRFEMPRLRAVNDLTPFGGPSMQCDNLMQMPYPVQRGAMESRQYAIYRLPASARDRVQHIEMAVTLGLEESSSQIQNWTVPFCNVFNCNCTPETWVHKYHQLENKVIEFPLAAHKVAQ